MDHAHPARRRHGQRSRLRHDGQDRGRPQQGRPWRPHLLLLQPALPGQVHRRAAALPEAGRRRPKPRRPKPGTIYTCPMHPEIRQVGPGSCPICGMALEPETVSAEQRPQSGTRRHDAPVLDRAGAGGAGAGARDGRAPDQPAHAAGPGDVELAAVRARHARRAVGRLAVLRARLAVAQDAQPQHVHPDRPGHRRGLDLQRRGRRSRPASSRRPSAAPTGRWRSISRRRR